MPSKIIKCIDCESERQEIEQGGAFEVIECTPLENQDDVPEPEKRCKITWQPKPI